MDLTSIPPNQHDILDNLTPQALQDLPEPQLAVEVERRQAWLDWCQQRLDTIDAELPALRVEHGHRLAAVAEVEPELVTAMKGTLQERELGVTVDAHWRAHNPAVSRLRDEHEKRTLHAQEMERLVSRREQERTRLLDEHIPRKRLMVEQAQQALETKRTQRLAVEAELHPSEPPTLLSLTARLFGRV